MQAFTLFVISLYLIGCSKYLEIDPSKTEIESTSIFASESLTNSAILSLYSKIKTDGSPYILALCTGIYGDELVSHSPLPELEAIYRNNIQPTNNAVYSQIWLPAYNNIYQANLIIEGVRENSVLPDNLKKQVEGEAKFIRAYWHFYLVNLFGDVPLVLTSDYSKNKLLPKTAKEEVYQSIIQDLKDAQSLVSDHYVGVDGITSSAERVRVNRSVATAMLSRVYLYHGDNAKAVEEASSVINMNSVFSLQADLNEVFSLSNTESIWSIWNSSEFGGWTSEGAGFILFNDPTGSFTDQQCTSISDMLLNQFEPSDQRKSSWIGQFNGYYFSNKYKVPEGGNGSVEYSIVLRLAEQYLIRAEALAREGDFVNAVHDLNIIRSRAGLDQYNGIVDQPNILQAIFHERQTELFCEWGHRWFDLKRTWLADNVMNEVAPDKGTEWNTNKQLFPIPQSEILNNPNLTQNDGYN